MNNPTHQNTENPTPMARLSSLFLLLHLAAVVGSAATAPTASAVPAPSSAFITTTTPNKGDDKQATTLSAYLRGAGGTQIYGNATKADDNDDDDDGEGSLVDRLADTPIAQSGTGATVTGAQVGSIAATGSLAYDSIGE